MEKSLKAVGFLLAICGQFRRVPEKLGWSTIRTHKRLKKEREENAFWIGKYEQMWEFLGMIPFSSNTNTVILQTNDETNEIT